MPVAAPRDGTVANTSRRHLRIVIADDDPLARRTIRNAVQTAGHVVLAEAADGREAVDLALYYRPHVVLMDVMMPNTDGIVAARRICAAAPEIRVVMLSTSDDAEIALEGLRAGASGFLVKTLDIRELPEILERTVAGEAAVDPRLALLLIRELRSPARLGVGSRPVRSELTDREWEVLDLLDSELSANQIAERLVVSLDTIRTHVKSVYRKLGVHNRDELTAVMRRVRTPSSVADDDMKRRR